MLNPIGNKVVNLGETLKFTVSATNSKWWPSELIRFPAAATESRQFQLCDGHIYVHAGCDAGRNLPAHFYRLEWPRSASETITITVPNPPPGGTTSVKGRVYNLNQSPLGNVKVTLKATGQTRVFRQQRILHHHWHSFRQAATDCQWQGSQSWCVRHPRRVSEFD